MTSSSYPLIHGCLNVIFNPVNWLSRHWITCVHILGDIMYISYILMHFRMLISRFRNRYGDVMIIPRRVYRQNTVRKSNAFTYQLFTSSCSLFHMHLADAYASHWSACSVMDVCMTPHYSDVIMSTMASQITSLTIVYSTAFSDEGHRKHLSIASLAFVRGIHRWPANSPHKWPVTRKKVSIGWRYHDLGMNIFTLYNRITFEQIVWTDSNIHIHKSTSGPSKRTYDKLQCSTWPHVRSLAIWRFFKNKVYIKRWRVFEDLSNWKIFENSSFSYTEAWKMLTFCSGHFPIHFAWI